MTDRITKVTRRSRNHIKSLAVTEFCSRDPNKWACAITRVGDASKRKEWQLGHNTVFRLTMESQPSHTLYEVAEAAIFRALSCLDSVSLMMWVRSMDSVLSQKKRTSRGCVRLQSEI